MFLADFSDQKITAAKAERFLQLTATVSQLLGLNVPTIIDMQQLRSLPVGTFGRLWADTLDQNQFKPLQTGPRRQQLHDGIHVLTGYGMDPLGEAEVQAFLLGARFRLIHILLGLALLKPMARQNRLNGSQFTHQHVKDRLRKAFIRGRQSCFDPDIWQPEKLWDQPVETVRAMYSVRHFASDTQ